MAWMDAYEAAELRKGRALEDLFGPEYEAFEREFEADPDGWGYRGDLESGLGHYYLVRNLGDFSAFVMPYEAEYRVYARGPAGRTTRHTVLPEYTLNQAKAYALRLMDELRERALEGSPA